MEAWTKLYQRIIQSSVWKLPSDVRVVWITLLALKDEGGCVYGTIGWLADQARVEPEVCEDAIGIFLSPDKSSRTADHEGRKIERIENGWRVLNHHLYRDGMEDMREKWRRQKAAQRAREIEEGMGPMDPELEESLRNLGKAEDRLKKRKGKPKTKEELAEIQEAWAESKAAESAEHAKIAEGLREAAT
jgi:hypothetical protein